MSIGPLSWSMGVAAVVVLDIHIVYIMYIKNV